MRSEIEKSLTVDSLCELERKLDYLDLPQVDPSRLLLGWRSLFRARGLKLFRNVVIAIGISLVPIALSILEGNFINSGLDVDAASAYGYWANNVLGLPAIVLSLGLYFGALPRTLARLVLMGPFRLTSNQWRSFVDESNQRFGQHSVRWLPAMVAVIVTVWVIGFFLGSDLNHWTRPAGASWGSWAGLLNVCVVTPILIYLLASLLIGLVITFRVLSSLFEHDLEIHPLHPDDCGGLKPLGNLSMRLNALILPFGIIIGINLWHNATSLGIPLVSLTSIVIVVTYTAGAAIVVFLPLLAAHRRMKSARQATVDRISRRFQVLNARLMSELEEDRTPDEEALEEVERVRRLYGMASEMPVLPFTLKNATAFLGAVAPPTLVFGLEQLLSNLN